MISHRVCRLEPWFLRALIPPDQVGSYIFYRAEAPICVGRSDTDLRRRLLQHAAPNYLDIECAFCSTNLHEVLDKRLVANP
jgi:hypothetical protein